MASITEETPVQTDTNNDLTASEALHSRLDTLWTTYLSHLDAYTKSQEFLQSHMRAGFFALARANFSTGSGVRRYGRDYYHDRAIATRRVAITPEPESGKARVEVVIWPKHQPDSEAESDSLVQMEKTGDLDAEVKRPLSPPPTPEPGSSDTKDEPPTAPQKTPLESNPLRWFGILIPPALRLSQNSFSSAVEGSVATAVNAVRGMRECEGEIRRLRKEIRRVERRGVGGEVGWVRCEGL